MLDNRHEKQCVIASGFYGRFILSLILAPPAQPPARLSCILSVIINRYYCRKQHALQSIMYSWTLGYNTLSHSAIWGTKIQIEVVYNIRNHICNTAKLQADLFYTRSQRRSG